MMCPNQQPLNSTTKETVSPPSPEHYLKSLRDRGIFTELLNGNSAGQLTIKDQDTLKRIAPIFPDLSVVSHLHHSSICCGLPPSVADSALLHFFATHDNDTLRDLERVLKPRLQQLQDFVCNPPKPRNSLDLTHRLIDQLAFLACNDVGDSDSFYCLAKLACADDKNRIHGHAYSKYAANLLEDLARSCRDIFVASSPLDFLRERAEQELPTTDAASAIEETAALLPYFSATPASKSKIFSAYDYLVLWESAQKSPSEHVLQEIEQRLAIFVESGPFTDLSKTIPLNILTRFTFEIFELLRPEAPLDNDNAILETFEHALCVTRAIIYPKLWLRLKFDPRRDGDSLQNQHSADLIYQTGHSLITDFFGDARESGYELGSLIVKALRGYGTPTQVSERFVLALGLMVQYKSLYSEVQLSEHAATIAGKGPEHEFTLRDLPEIIHRCQSRNGTREAAISYSFKSADQLTDTITEILDIVKDFKGKHREQVIIRSMSELLAALSQTRLPEFKSIHPTAISLIREYFSKFGIEPHPLLFLSFSAVKTGVSIDRVLTAYQQSRFASAEMLKASDIRWIAPLAAKSISAKQSTWGKIKRWCNNQLAALGLAEPDPQPIWDAASDVARLLQLTSKTGISGYTSARTLTKALSTYSFRTLYGPVPHLPLDRPIELKDFESWFDSTRASIAEGLPLRDLDLLLSDHPLVAEAGIHSCGILASRRERTSSNPYSLNPRRSATDLQRMSRHSIENALSHIARSASCTDLPLPHYGAYEIRLDIKPIHGKGSQADLHSYFSAPRGYRITCPRQPLATTQALASLEGDILIARREKPESLLLQIKMAALEGEVSSPLRERIKNADSLEKVVCEAIKHSQMLCASLPEDERAISAIVPHPILPLLRIALFQKVLSKDLPDDFKYINDLKSGYRYRLETVTETVLEAIVAWSSDLEMRNSFSEQEIERFVGTLLSESVLQAQLSEQQLQPATEYGTQLPLKVLTYPTRGMPLSLMGQLTDSCIVQVPEPRLQRSNLVFFPFIDPAAGTARPLIIGGTGVIGVTGPRPAGDSRPGPAKYLLIRCFNVREERLNELHPGLFMESFIAVLIRYGKAWGFDYIAAPDAVADGYGLSNLRPFIYHVRQIYRKGVGEHGPVERVMLPPDATQLNTTVISRPCLVIEDIHHPKRKQRLEAYGRRRTHTP